MTDIMITPEELNPTNGNENNNLQSNSEENTQSENTDKKSLTHDPEMFKRIIEEIERKEAEEEQKPEIKPVAPTRDPSIWERKSEEDDPTPTEGEEENIERANEKDPDEDDEKMDVDEQLNQSAGRRHLKQDNTKIANLKRTQNQKQKKVDRLTQEISKQKADLDRGYLIVPLAEGSEKVKHVKLNKSDREIIEAAIAFNEYDKLETGLDIGEIENKIIDLASRKKSSYKNRINKKKANLKESELVKRIDKELDKASKNGSKEIVSKIKQQAQSGDKNDAYDSLKSFLSQEVKTVAKKLDKDAKLEKNVLDRVIDKISASQS